MRYVLKLQEVQERKKFEFVEIVSNYVKYTRKVMILISIHLISEYCELGTFYIPEQENKARFFSVPVLLS